MSVSLKLSSAQCPFHLTVDFNDLNRGGFHVIRGDGCDWRREARGVESTHMAELLLLLLRNRYSTFLSGVFAEKPSRVTLKSLSPP